MNASIVSRTCYYKIVKHNGEIIYDKNSFDRHIKYPLSPLLDEDFTVMRKKYPNCQVLRTCKDDYLNSEEGMKMEEFKHGDRVEHARRGKGTFLAYGTFSDDSIVEFDKDSDAEGETLTVTTGLLRKIEK